MDIVYSEVVELLDPNNPDARDELDASLGGVEEWRVPGDSVRVKQAAQQRQRADIPIGAPSWWRGDEEASQTFLRGMGAS